MSISPSSLDTVRQLMKSGELGREVGDMIQSLGDEAAAVIGKGRSQGEYEEAMPAAEARLRLRGLWRPAWDALGDVMQSESYKAKGRALNL